MTEIFSIASQAAGFISLKGPIVDISDYSVGTVHKINIPDGMINIGGNGRGFTIVSVNPFTFSPALTEGEYIIYAIAPADGTDIVTLAYISFNNYVNVLGGDNNSQRAIAYFKVVSNGLDSKNHIVPNSIITFGDSNAEYIFRNSLNYVGKTIDEFSKFDTAVRDFNVVYFDGTASKYKKAIAVDSGTVNSPHKFIGIASVTDRVVMTQGFINMGSNMPNATYPAGTYVYLHDSIAGSITNGETSIRIGLSLGNGLLLLSSGVGGSGGGSGGTGDITQEDILINNLFTSLSYSSAYYNTMKKPVGADPNYLVSGLVYSSTDNNYSGGSGDYIQRTSLPLGATYNKLYVHLESDNPGNIQVSINSVNQNQDQDINLVTGISTATIRLTWLGAANLDAFAIFWNWQDPPFSFSRMHKTLTLVSDVVPTAEVTQITTVAGSTLANKWFHLYSANDIKHYYVWYNVDGAGVNPNPNPAWTGAVVAINSTDTAAQVATATAAVLEALADFASTSLSSVVTVTNSATGPCTNASNGTASPGFSFNITIQGSGNLKLPDSAMFIPKGINGIQSMYVYRNGLLQVEGIDYVELLLPGSTYSKDTIAPKTTWATGNVIQFVEAYTHIDVSKDNTERLNYEHNSAGEHIFVDRVTSLPRRLYVSSGSVLTEAV